MKNSFPLFSIGLLWFWLGFCVLIPTLLVIIASFLSRGEQDFVVFTWTLQNYSRLFDPLYLAVFWHSCYLAFLTTLGCLLLGYPFAYLLTKTANRYKQLLLLLVIIPFWTSSLIRTYAMMMILKTQGLLNSLLLWCNLQPIEILYTETAVLVGLIYSLLPFMVLPLYANLEKLDQRLVEAARDLGARPQQVVTQILIPLTIPGIVAGSMLVFLPTLGLFYISDLLGGSKNLLIGNLIESQFLAARDWPFGAAISVILMLIIALFLLAQWRVSFIRKMI